MTDHEQAAPGAPGSPAGPAPLPGPGGPGAPGGGHPIPGLGEYTEYASSGAAAEETVAIAEICQAISSMARGNPGGARDAIVLLMRVGGDTLQEVAEKLQLHRTRVAQLEFRSARRIRRLLRDPGWLQLRGIARSEQ